MNNNKRIAGFKALLTAWFIGLALFAGAQDYIDEDFLGNLASNAKLILNEQDAAFKENIIPSKWDKQSAVVIGYTRSILFDRKSRGGFLTRKERSLWFLEKKHFKIKLNDNNSVQAFSEIYFRYGSKEDGFIARIIKPDGRIVDVDLKSAVGIDNQNIPEYFQSFFDKVNYSDYQYYKVPVGDLEPGDILEYVATTKSKLDVTSSGYIEFTPAYEVCSKQYPIMYNQIAIETDDKSYFKYLSLNGAPKFVKENSTDGFFRYVFVDKDRDTEKDVNFVSPFLQYPMVKFQVIYSNSDDVKGALIGAKGELKTQFSREELARKAWEDYESVGDLFYSREYGTVQSFIDRCWTELQKLGAKSWPEKQYIDTAYYLIRNKGLFRDNYLSDKVFAYCFGSLLYQRDIKSDVIISIGNDIGKMKDILFEEEIRYAIKVGDKLFFNTTDYSIPGEQVESLLNNDAYIIYAPAKKGGAQDIKPFTLPGTTAADNVEDQSIKTELSPDMKNLMVIRTISYKGIQKARSIADALKFTTYMLDDYKNYGGNPPTDKMKSKELDEYTASVQALKEEFKKQKPDFVKAKLESEFSQPVQNIHFDLISDGRSMKKNTLVVKEGFELEDYVRRAGKKYMLNLPGLIGSQLQIKKEERDRKYDIDVHYPKTLTWSINFKIPDGYTVDGLTELNKSVDNETGTFSIAAKEENGFVIMNISKVYKQKDISKDKWNDLLAVLDTVYNSSFKYILLTPKQ